MSQIPLSYGEKLTRNQAGNDLLTVFAIAAAVVIAAAAVVLLVKKLRSRAR